MKVWAYDPYKFVSTYAFIDKDSNVNMYARNFAKRLGDSVSAGNMDLLTSYATSPMTEKVDSFRIMGVDEPCSFFL